MTPHVRKRPPQPGWAAVNLAAPMLSPAAPRGEVSEQVGGLLDVDAMVADLDGALVVRIVVDDDGQTRDLIFRSSEGAERYLRRAEARGRSARVLLCRLHPVEAVTL